MAKCMALKSQILGSDLSFTMRDFFFKVKFLTDILQVVFDLVYHLSKQHSSLFMFLPF